MTDLFESMAEHHAERLAIMQESGIPTAVEDAATDFFRCEVKAVMRQCYPDGKKAAGYFNEVERRRGKDQADKLRDAVRAEWKKRNLETGGRA